MKTLLPVLAASVCALVLPLYVSAAANNTVPATQNSKTQEKHKAMASLWPPETLSGTVTIVDPKQKLLVVQASNGIPFDLQLSPSTRIMDGTRRIELKDLGQDINKSVSVRFVPAPRGDIARTITVGG